MADRYRIDIPPHNILKDLHISLLEIADEITFLSEAIKELNKGLNLEKTMERFLRSAIRFSRADGGTVFVHRSKEEIIALRSINFPDDVESLCLIKKKAYEKEKIYPVKETCLAESLGEGVLLIRTHHMLWNLQGSLVLYFRNGVPDLPEVMDILYEVGFSALVNALSFDLTSKSQAMWQAIVDEIPDVILVLDEKETVLRCNMAFAGIQGMHPRDIVGKRLSDLPLEEDIKICIGNVLSPQGGSRTKEVTCGNRVFLVTSKKIVLPDGRTANLFIGRDITETRQLQQQLYHADKLASLGMLVSGVAHEINNPLTGIMGYAELLLTRTKDGPIREGLEKIYHSGERCKKIVENLLAFSRQRPPQKVPVLLDDLIEGTLELRSYWFRANDIKVVKQLQKVPYIKADPQQLQQVFLNIIINAEDALMASDKEEKKLIVKTLYEEDTKRVIVEIEDNGIGIPEDIQSKIFDPFFTTKPVGKGTGLGLSISYGIISEHSGSISLKSTPGEGTTFRIELPLHIDK